MQTGRIGSLASWNNANIKKNNNTTLLSQQAAFSTGAGNSKQSGFLLAVNTSGALGLCSSGQFGTERLGSRNIFDQDLLNSFCSAHEQKPPRVQYCPLRKEHTKAGPHFVDQNSKTKPEMDLITG
jgi:hypothetical protein